MGKKKAPKNAYFYYMLDFQKKQELGGNRLPLDKISVLASPSWTKLGPNERAPYEKKAKEEKSKTKHAGERYTSHGIPYSEIDRQQRELEDREYRMKKKVEDLVVQSIDHNIAISQKYYFIMANHFCMTNSGVFVPAELALAEFCLKYGVTKKLHTCINPDALPLGYLHTAKVLSETEHRLPYPPNAKGEKRFDKIFESILDFVKPTSDGIVTVFTKADNIPMLESILGQLSDATGEEAKPIDLFPLESLFFYLKKEADKVTGDQCSIHVTNMMLGLDTFDHRVGIACAFHDREDASKYCALSHVNRWAFIFADHLCVKMGVKLIPGIHLPEDVDVTIIDDDDEDENTVKEDNDDFEDEEYDVKSEVSSVSASRLMQPHYRIESDNESLLTNENDEENDAFEWQTQHSRRSQLRARLPNPEVFNETRDSGDQWSFKRGTVVNSGSNERQASESTPGTSRMWK